MATDPKRFIQSAVAALAASPVSKTKRPGNVYLLTNPSMPGLVKIGWTSDTEDRAKQLFTTGVPTPFEVAHSFGHPDAYWAEQVLHKAFADYRVADGREFFRVDPTTVVAVLDAFGDVAHAPGPFAPVVRHSLRDYQRQAVEKSIEALNGGGRASIVSACGTGKTLMQLRLAEQLDARLVVVATPKIALTAQTLDYWLDQSDANFVPIVVCSDRGAIDKQVLDGLAGWLTVTTNPQVIANSVAAAVRQEDRAIVFSTHMSLPKVAEALASVGDEADLLIVDEAHRTAGAKSAIKTAAVESIPSTLRTFWTATPRVTELDKKGRPKVPYSMDDVS